MEATKPGDVGHDAAAHTDDEGAPVGPHVEELAVDLFELDESLAAFALTDDDMFVRIDESQVVGMYLGVGHDDDAGRSPGSRLSKFSSTEPITTRDVAPSSHTILMISSYVIPR